MNRRQFLQLTAAASASSIFPRWATGVRAQSHSGERPNIVLIMADDMGYSDIGCYGGEVHTPNLDRLAEGGLRFSHFYNGARCCPTRASLLTGLYAHQAGIGHMVGDKGYPPYQGYLNDRCVTIAEALKPAGYRTLMAGKWHVGEQRSHWPTDRGFDRYFGLVSGGANYFDITKTKAKGVTRTMALDDQPYEPPKEGFYITDAFSDHAVKFIDEDGRDDRPFFLYLAYTAPHWPLHAWPEDIAKYKGKYRKGWDKLREERYARMVRMGLISDRWKMSPRDATTWPWAEEKDKELMDLKMAVYAAQIERMDHGIGRILGKIKELGEEENTRPVAGSATWTTAFFTERWDTGPGEHGDFPSKWMSEDGRTLYLVFSGDDQFCVRKATLKLRQPAETMSTPRPQWPRPPEGIVDDAFPYLSNLLSWSMASPPPLAQPGRTGRTP